MADIPPPVVVVGTYRSGSSAVAGILHFLRVDMGSPYWGAHFEALDLSRALRQWWSEPRLVASMTAERRQQHLGAWLTSRQAAAHGRPVGAKHPLLSLCNRDVYQAWGNATRFVWCRRPLEESVRSLVKMNWWSDCRRIQRQLHQANCQFFADVTAIEVPYAELRAAPRRSIERLIDQLQLTPTAEDVTRAVQWIETWPASARWQEAPTANAAITNAAPTASGEAVAVSELAPAQWPTPRSSKIVATLLSDSCQAIVAEAVESVIPWVDELCLIDTGIADETRQRVAAVAGDKLVMRRFDWCHDFAAARNAALSCAAERGATWALTIDTDERLSFTGYRSIDDLRLILQSQPQAQAWLVPVRQGSYSKERFIRLPGNWQWRGRTHETLTHEGGYLRRHMPGCCFWELRKSPAERERKLQRDLAILQQETAAQPLNTRWWYYLGQTYEGLGQFRAAIEAFERCIRLDGWSEESAWACYATARCLVALQEYRPAEEYCGVGMSRKPSAPELPWMAGWCCYQRGAWDDAVTWSQLAITLGGPPRPEGAALFRHLPAWFEAPHDVLRHAWRALGQSQLAERAAADFEAAKANRLILFPAANEPSHA